jgi:hypothetical protein
VVEASPYFDTRVEQVAGPIATQRAAQAVRAGQMLSGRQSAQQQHMSMTGVSRTGG